MIIVARLAEVGQPDRGDVDLVQLGKHTVHLVIELPALDTVDLRNRGIPEDASVTELHDVKHRADDVAILAQVVGPGDRDFGVRKRLEDTKLAVDGMRRFQEFPGGLAAQHVDARACRDAKGRVRLAAGELLHLDGPAKALNVRFQVGQEHIDVELADR